MAKANTGAKAPKTKEHTVTQEDLDNNKDLVDQGVKVGDVIEIDLEEEVETPKAKAKATPKADAKEEKKEQTPAEIRADEKAKKRIANAEKIAGEKKVTVTLRSRLVWNGRRKKEFDQLEVSESQAVHLKAAGKIASAEEIKKFKNGDEIQNQ